MNILPKKRWHVRTKENIERVRRDEAKAAEEERVTKARVQKAETEARTNLLRDQARLKYDGQQIAESKDAGTAKGSTPAATLQHVNFFINVECGKTDYSKLNIEHAAEKKKEQEKYEKQIGYLTYLGQDTNEATGNKSWYNECPKRLTEYEENEEAAVKMKIVNDPMNDIKKYLKIISSSSSTSTNRDILKLKSNVTLKRKLNDSQSTTVVNDDREYRLYKKYKRNKSNRRKKAKINDPSLNIDLDRLRAERLQRENVETLKAQMLLAKRNGNSIEPFVKEAPRPAIQQKYNSQFNPEIARQNAENIRRR